MNRTFRNKLLIGILLYLPLIVSGAEKDCAEIISLACGNTPSAAFDKTGRLWLAFEQRERIYVTYTEDLGDSFSQAKAVNVSPEPVYAKGENRPKLAHGNNGEIFVSWTRKGAQRFTGDIRFSRSIDGGKRFSQPYTVNDDGLQTSHRFDALYVTNSGKIFLSWLDKRDQVKQREKGLDYQGAALYYAVSDNDGASFSNNIKVEDHSCECCRVAIDGYGNDKVAVMWRQIYNGTTRDHALAILGIGGPALSTRASVDDWQINACPHHGPDIALSADGERYHMTWFSSGTVHKGLYYDRLVVDSGNSVKPMAIDSRAGAGHPQVAVAGSSVFLLWKYFDGKVTLLNMMQSEDDGNSWTETTTLLHTSAASDHPQLLQYGSKTYAAWHTRDEGYRIVAVN